MTLNASPSSKVVNSPVAPLKARMYERVEDHEVKYELTPPLRTSEENPSLPNILSGGRNNTKNFFFYISNVFRQNY